MFTTRFARSSPRLAAQLRAPQRRLASTDKTNNVFVNERRRIKEHAKETTELWMKICLYAVIPAIAVAGGNAWWLWRAHWQHWEHLPPLEDRTEYSYQNVRTKNYQWGNGDKTLFWNDSVNYHNKNKA